MRISATAAVAAMAVLAGFPAQAPAGQPDDCGAVRVPGAAEQKLACLDDLTTAGTVRSGHTVPADWAGLTSAGLPQQSGVPGTQVDGYFPDSSATNTNNGWNHDSQFVIRLPDDWNGGLVVSGSPGNRRQYANDRAIADQVLSAGYAFAATDKGNTGTEFFRDGKAPGDAIAEWNHRLTQLTVAARAAVAQRYHRPPRTVLAAGISNGGYLVRWQLENRPRLYDGGVDAEGTLWTPGGPNLLTSLPSALRHYPAYAAGDERAHRAMLRAGFARGSEFLWDYHYRVYWDLTQRIYREEVDPGYDGDLAAGIPYCASGTPACDADYDYASRPESVHRAVERISLTGRIGKPLVTVHGTLDSLLPIGEDSDVYRGMIRDAGRGAQHRYYRIEDANHVDGLVDVYPDRLRPLVPCMHSAFDALARWVEDGTPPPRSATVPRPPGADPAELSATCSLRP